MGIIAKSSLGKYIHDIKQSPPQIYNYRLLLTVFMYALAGMPKGWDEGTAASVTQLPSFQHAFQITPKGNPNQISNIVSLVNATAGVGAFLSFLLNDRAGRVWSYRVYMTIYAIGNLTETFSYGNLPALYVGRLVTGLGIGALTVTGPMSIVEIAPASTRGLMALWFNVCMLFSQMTGIFVVYGCKTNISNGGHLQYQIPFFVQCFVPAIGIVMSFFLSESPRWLCLRGKYEEALDCLTKLRKLDAHHSYLQTEWSAMSIRSAREESEYKVQLVITAYILAQLSGANAVTNYLPQIYGLVGVKSTSVQVYSAGLYAMVKAICCIISSLLLVDVIGRRKSLFVGITIQMICHSYLAGYLNVFISDPNSVPQAASTTAIVVIFIHALGWAVGLYSLPYLFGAELWPNHIRSFGGALSQGFHWLFYFAITKATPSILSSMDQWGAFLFFAAWCLIALIYVYIAVPETAGKGLENIDVLFDHPWYMMRRNAKIRKSQPGEIESADPGKESVEELEHVI